MKKQVALFALLGWVIVSCQKVSSDSVNKGITGLQTPLASFALEPLPEWSNKYQEPVEYRTFYDVDKLMKTFSLTRLDAIAVQSCIRFDVVTLQKRQAQTSDLELCLSKVRTEKKKEEPKKKFQIVFDLDETLYDQFQANETCHTHSFIKNGKKKYFYVAPFAESIIQNIFDNGGAVVFFSANLDVPTQENLKAWTTKEGDMLSSRYLSGLFFNSHLALYPKEAKGAPSPILHASKDLRMFDEDLKSTIIVDDNPVRLFQPQNHRLVKKFFAPQYCNGDKGVRLAFEHQLKKVWEEIQESVAYMEKKHCDFRQAYLPYSMAGSLAMQWLAKSNGWSEAQAAEYIRENPKTVDAYF